MNHLEGVIPIEKIHRIAAVRGTELPGYLSHPWFTARTGDRARTCAGAAGCVLSHARALQYALEHEDCRSSWFWRMTPVWMWSGWRG